jgi:PAT family acetyl-CoA transporter-like MFS transporter 1
MSNRKLRDSGSRSSEDFEAVDEDSSLKLRKNSKRMNISSHIKNFNRNLNGDGASIALLLLLYTLQGVPMGLASSIPLLLQERGASYTDQSLFSLVSWPFSLKLLWAPIVDGFYASSFGRRKSWLIPVQLICGLMMVMTSSMINEMLGDKSKPPDVRGLTIFFFVLYFLMATQDIAVDGWAITILSHKNVGWASTCNAIGQAVGNVVSFILFMALNSAEVPVPIPVPIGNRVQYVLLHFIDVETISPILFR